MMTSWHPCLQFDLELFFMSYTQIGRILLILGADRSSYLRIMRATSPKFAFPLRQLQVGVPQHPD